MASESGAPHWSTSLRERPLEDTLTAARRLAQQVGLVHLLDVTSLDHLGLPVFMSVTRAGTRALVHSGKGLEREAARVGALMEAIEHATCQAVSRTTAVQQAPLRFLQDQWPNGLGVVDFVPRLGARLTPRASIPVVRCEWMGTRQSTLLPAELVLMPAPGRRGPPLFGSSSNGLASGNTLSEATLHALLEVIERDTVTLNMARDESRSVAMATLPRPFSDLVPAWRRRGVRLHLRYLPNDLRLPCFEAWLHEPGAGDSPVAACSGWGLHFDRHIALSRAICEAAQSRHGSMRAFLDKYLTPIQGKIVDTQGNVLGEHDGTYHYTIGQRKGLGVAAANPLYVIALDPVKNEVVVGDRTEAHDKECMINQVNWVSLAPTDIPFTAEVQVRYRTEPAAATVIPLTGDRARIVFDEPQFSITPGQAAVFYHGDMLLGGGLIESKL